MRKAGEGSTQGDPLGQPGLQDQIVTDAPLLEVKMASHTLGWVKNIRESGEFREKPMWTTPTPCTCVLLAGGGNRKATLYNPNLQSADKSARAIRTEKRHREELSKASLIKNTLLSQSKELEGLLPPKP